MHVLWLRTSTAVAFGYALIYETRRRSKGLNYIIKMEHIAPARDSVSIGCFLYNWDRQLIVLTRPLNSFNHLHMLYLFGVQKMKKSTEMKTTTIEGNTENKIGKLPL